MEEKRPSQLPRSGFWDAWFGGLDPLPGDEKLGPQPSLIECFNRLSTKQMVGVVITGLVIAALGYAILVGSFALSSY